MTPPLFRLMDTRGNRESTWAQIVAAVTDPENPDDILKQDVDPLTGEGGDDSLEETRYALMSRPVGAAKPDPVFDRVQQKRLLAGIQNPDQSRPVPWAFTQPVWERPTTELQVFQ
jgi:hypothetical protein